MGGKLSQISLRTPFFVQAAVIALDVLVLFVVMPRPEPVAKAPGSPGAATAKTSWEVFKEHRGVFKRVAFFVFCMMIGRESRNVLFPLKALDLGLDAEQIGQMTAASYLLESCMFPFSGILMDKYGRKYSGVPAALIMSASFLLGPLANSYATLTAVNVLGGMGNGLSSGLLMTIGGDLAPDDARAQFLAIYRVFCDSGVMLGPLASGLLTDELEVKWAFWTISMIAAIAALWMVLLVPETHRSEQAGKSGSTSSSSGKKPAVNTHKKQKSKRVVKVKGGKGKSGRAAYSAVQHEASPVPGEVSTLADM
jgi:MFS family permease